MILHKKKITVLMMILLSVIIMSFKTASEDKNAPQFKNLRVLPKNISHDDLIAVMKSYCTSLGVRCGQCHAKMADSDKFDFASDEKEDKGIARKMIKMANAINKKYFSVSAGTIGCMTCHNGKSNPTEANKKLIQPIVSPQPADSTKRN